MGLPVSLSDWAMLALLAVVGAIASAINAVAGGGSLISFPALVFGFGLPSIPANATNAVSQWPGSLAGGIGFLNLLPSTKRHFKILVGPTIVGSIIGAFLLVSTPARLFSVAVPGLIALATVLLAFQPQIKAWSLGRDHRSSVLQEHSFKCWSVFTEATSGRGWGS